MVRGFGILAASYTLKRLAFQKPSGIWDFGVFGFFVDLGCWGLGFEGYGEETFKKSGAKCKSKSKR